MDDKISVAKGVVTDRIATPEVAGSVDPQRWLPLERAQLLADLAKLRQPEHLLPETPKACHRFGREEERKLALRLLNAQMAVLVPEDDLPRCSSGRLLLGGLFAVDKDEHHDR